MKRLVLKRWPTYVVCPLKHVTFVSAWMCFLSDEELNVEFCKSISLYR